MYIGRLFKMKNEANIIACTVNAAKQLAIVSLTLLLLGCSSGGSGGAEDDTMNPNQPADTGGEMETDGEEGTETGTESGALLVDQPDVNWTACDNQPALECTSLLVPLDYSNPTGESIRVAMARRLANETTGSRTLFMNPGGPGAGGIDTLDLMLRFDPISDEMKNAFNFVSFDPRGTGASDSVRCTTAETLGENRYQTTRAEVESGFNATAQLAQDCAQNHGKFLQQLSSNNVVRDIDEMRKVLGLNQIDFLGFSYGTRLAALYMQTYPEYTGRFVLDGSVSPSADVATLVRGFISPGQVNIERLASFCTVNTLVDCTPTQFETDLRLRMEELAATEPASIETEMLYYILIVGFASPSSAGELNTDLSRYLETQDITLLENLYSRLGLDQGTGEEGPINITTYTAVFCADDFTRPTVESLNALRIELNAQSDLLAELMMYPANICAGWPEALDPVPRIATNQAPASLVIGGPSDARTPLVHAQEMAEALGGQFLRSEHEGHITVFTIKNDCTNAVTETFLLTGNLPTISVCEANDVANAGMAVRRQGRPHLLH